MRRYRFTWDAFSDDTVEGLALSLGFRPSGGDPRDFLVRQVKRPSVGYVKAQKGAILKHWLADYKGTQQIVARLRDRGIGPMSSPRSQKGALKYLQSTRNCLSLQKTISEAMLRFGDQDRHPEDIDDPDFTPRFAVLEPARQARDPRKPYPCQREAWEKLDLHLAQHDTSGVFQGLLVMPTGAGKTFTTVHWLMRKVINRGLRVLWLAHRQELLEQAARAFHRLSGFASERERLRVRIVSGAHCATSQIDPEDDVVIASVMSLRARADLRDEMLADPRLFLIIDEAHHAPAKSYRDILKGLQHNPPVRCLGLTATPTRTIADERPVLSMLFGGRILHRVETRTLIEQGLLSRPTLVRVQTLANVEAGVTEQDLTHLDKFGELGEKWLKRIAAITARNKIIIDHYLSHRTRYNKTLIFAINVTHAALLATRLREHGVRADYVASYRPDGTPGDNKALIDSFRAGDLDVLVNVQIATEGVDIPSVQTVFLTRPTQSEILLRQMVGRGLRGPKAGGTETAWLVGFEDQWAHYQEWDSPFELVMDLVAEPDDEDTDDEDSPSVSELIECLPWDLIREVASRMRQISVDLKADAFDAIPHGMYVLEHEIDVESTFRHVISVYEHQKPCWEAFFDYLSSMPAIRRKSQGAQLLYLDNFADCDVPAPSLRDVQLALAHMKRTDAERPEYIPLSERQLADPYELAHQIHEEDLRRSEEAALIASRYGASPLARAIYPTLRDFDAAIKDALYEIEHPDEATRIPKAVPIFNPGPEDHLTPGPHHDLNALFDDVLNKGAPLLGLKAPLPHKGRLKWTTRLVKGWFGRAYFREGPQAGHGKIFINKLLDSPDVPAEVLRFLLWHEYLHLYLKSLHTSDFKRLEKLWPTYKEGDRFLDNLNEHFDIQYW